MCSNYFTLVYQGPWLHLQHEVEYHRWRKLSPASLPNDINGHFPTFIRSAFYTDQADSASMTLPQLKKPDLTLFRWPRSVSSSSSRESDPILMPEPFKRSKRHVLFTKSKALLLSTSNTLVGMPDINACSLPHGYQTSFTDMIDATDNHVVGQSG